MLSQAVDFHRKTDPKRCLPSYRHAEMTQAGGPWQHSRFETHSFHDSVTALIWTVREFHSDTTDGQHRAVDGQILRKLQKQVQEKRKREQNSSTKCEGGKVGCCLFLLLILKSSVIRMRGREHVA